MNLTLKKLAALLLTVLLVVSLFSTVTFAANGQKREKLAIPTIENGHGFTPVKITGNRALTESYLRGDTARINATLPSRYDGRDYNYLTPVRNQLDSPASSDEQTCWAFATIASVEAYMIKHGVTDASTGLPATTSLNLSESHLAWFNYTNAYDKKGMLGGDYTRPMNANYVENTGHYTMSTYTLMRWEGVASETTDALKYTNMSTSGLNSQYAYDYDVAHVTNVEWIPLTNRDAVKRGIMEYGAGGVSLCFYDDYRVYNSSTAAYCYNQHASSNYERGNHAVTVVGWDDNYSKSNFASYGYGPTSNGAWIIRDSYGTSNHEGGYFYLSYEDTASYYERAFFYAADNADNFTNCYQYDGTANANNYCMMGNNCQISNVFTASSAETLKAVSVATFDEAVSYTLQVYKNPSSASNPTSGTLMTSQNGYIAFPGYTTVNLNNPVALNANDVFVVVFTLSTPAVGSDGYYLHMPVDTTYDEGWVYFYHSSKGSNTSFYRESNGNWNNISRNGNFRIKAYTDPSTSTHTHSYGAWTSNSNGTHSRTCSCGDKQTANCTYRDVVTAPTTTSQGYTTHTCTVCGYSYKDSYTDPVVPTTYYTVTFSVPSGVSSISSQTVSANSTITLPTAGAPTGYTFKGWVTSAVSDTTTMPSYLTGSYKVTGNVTLRALYAYTTTSGSGVSGYQLVTSAPSSWAGNYVITYGTASSSMYLLKGVTPSSNGAKIESSANTVTFANSGASLSSNVLTNVANNYVFTLAAHGSYYSAQNASTGAYLGVNSSGYLSCYTTYTSGSCDWTPGVGTSASSMKSAYGGSYPYLGFTTSSKYFWAGSSVNTSVRLWKQTSGSGSSTTHYTTSPTTSSHTHSYGAWTSNNNGTHSRTCSCGDKQTANCTYRDVVTAPTTTSQGYTTHTCTVCGYSYKDNYTDPVAPTTYYTVTFSTPSGVTAPASQTVAANSYVTLPTASAPSGYTFKGWVTSAVSNTTTMPSYLTGSYKVTGNITLRALYSYTSTSGGSGTTYTLVGSTPSSWAGNYIITYGTNTGSMYVMKGLSGEVKYETSTSGSAVLLANTGMTYSNGTLTGATAPYVFKVAADGSYYTIQNSSTGTYVASKSSYLYSLPSYNSSYCRWTLSCSSNNVTAKNTASSSYCYLSCYTSSKYFMLNSSVPTGLYFWKQTSTGGTSTTYYTTG